MKLPRLSNPTTYKIVESEFLGETVTTEITIASEFDLLPTIYQWTILGIVLLPALCLLGYSIHSKF